MEYPPDVLDAAVIVEDRRTCTLSSVRSARAESSTRHALQRRQRVVAMHA
jgi:hypothetical protein